MIEEILNDTVTITAVILGGFLVLGFLALAAFAIYLGVAG